MSRDASLTTSGTPSNVESQILQERDRTTYYPACYGHGVQAGLKPRLWVHQDYSTAYIDFARSVQFAFLVAHPSYDTPPKVVNYICFG